MGSDRSRSPRWPIYIDVMMGQLSLSHSAADMGRICINVCRNRADVRVYPSTFYTMAAPNPIVFLDVRSFFCFVMYQVIVAANHRSRSEVCNCDDHGPGILVLTGR